MREVRYFIIGGRGDGILPGRNGQEGALFFLFFLPLVVTWYTLVLYAPLCGDVHKGRVYICGLFEEGWMPNPDPDPRKVCFFNLEWKRFVASSWKLN